MYLSGDWHDLFKVLTIEDYLPLTGTSSYKATTKLNEHTIDSEKERKLIKHKSTWICIVYMRILQTVSAPNKHKKQMLVQQFSTVYGIIFLSVLSAQMCSVCLCANSWRLKEVSSNWSSLSCGIVALKCANTDQDYLPQHFKQAHTLNECDMNPNKPATPQSKLQMLQGSNLSCRWTLWLSYTGNNKVVTRCATEIP